MISNSDAISLESQAGEALTTSIEVITEQKQPYGWPTLPPGIDNMPPYFIRTGDGPHDWILNPGEFDFKAHAGNVGSWFNGESDPSSSEQDPIPSIDSQLTNFDLFDKKLLQLMRIYAKVLRKFYPKGMESNCKTQFATCVAFQFKHMERKYQELLHRKRQGEDIGKRVKPTSLRWLNVVGFINDKWSTQIDCKDRNRPRIRNNGDKVAKRNRDRAKKTK